MKPIEFPEQNIIATSNDENVKPLPIYFSEESMSSVLMVHKLMPPVVAAS